MTMNDPILCCDMPNDYQKWSLYEGCQGNDSICSDMDNCEKMLTDAWLIHCGPCIINVPEEFSNLEFWNSFQSNKGGSERRTGAAKRKGGIWRN